MLPAASTSGRREETASLRRDYHLEVVRGIDSDCNRPAALVNVRLKGTDRRTARAKENHAEVEKRPNPQAHDASPATEPIYRRVENICARHHRFEVSSIVIR